MQSNPPTISNETLYFTHAQGKLHVRQCPHIHGVEPLHEATAEQVSEKQVCTWCARELAGEGRTYFDTLDDALRDFGHVSDEAHRLIREALAGIDYDEVYVPGSRSYIALGSQGLGVAWIGVGFVERKGQPTVELPWFVPTAGGGARQTEELRGDVCEIHFVERSVTGECELC